MVDSLNTSLVADIIFSLLYCVFAVVVLNFGDVDGVVNEDSKPHFTIYNHGSLSISGTLVCSLVPLFLLRIALDIAQISDRNKNPYTEEAKEKVKSLLNAQNGKKASQDETRSLLNNKQYEAEKAYKATIANTVHVSDDGVEPKPYKYEGHSWRIQLTSVSFILVGLLFGIVSTYKDINDDPAKYDMTSSQVRDLFKKSILYPTTFTDRCEKISRRNPGDSSTALVEYDIKDGLYVWNADTLTEIRQRNEEGDTKSSCWREIVQVNITSDCAESKTPKATSADGTGFKECVVPPVSYNTQNTQPWYPTTQADLDKYSPRYPLPKSLEEAKGFGKSCAKSQTCVAVAPNTELDLFRLGDATVAQPALEARRTALTGKSVCVKNSDFADQADATNIYSCDADDIILIDDRLANGWSSGGKNTLYGKEYTPWHGAKDANSLGGFRLNYTRFYDFDQDDSRKLDIDQDYTLTLFIFFTVLVFRILDLALSFEFPMGMCQCRRNSADADAVGQGAPTYHLGLQPSAKTGIIFFFLIITVGCLIHGHLQVTNHNWIDSIIEGEEKGWDPSRVPNAHEHYNGYAWENILAASFVGLHLFLAFIAVLKTGDRGVIKFKGQEYDLTLISQHPTARQFIVTAALGLISVNIGRLVVYGSEITFLAAALVSYFVVDCIGANFL